MAENPTLVLYSKELWPHPQGRPGPGRVVTHLTEQRRLFVPSRAMGFLIISPPKKRLKRSKEREAPFPSNTQTVITAQSAWGAAVVIVTWLLLARQAAHSFSQLGC